MLLKHEFYVQGLVQFVGYELVYVSQLRGRCAVLSRGFLFFKPYQIRSLANQRVQGNILAGILIWEAPYADMFSNL
jgi:hypothetical protein